MIIALLDTNVLVYSVDQRFEDKRRRALDVIERLSGLESAALSVQVLAEFFNVSTRKLVPPLSAEQAIDKVEVFMQLFPTFALTPLIVTEAARGVRDHQFSYYDAQLWATARLNQIPLIFSEDFNSGSTIEGVTFVNPFEEGFRLEDWITYR